MWTYPDLPCIKDSKRTETGMRSKHIQFLIPGSSQTYEKAQVSLLDWWLLEQPFLLLWQKEEPLMLWWDRQHT